MKRRRPAPEPMPSLSAQILDLPRMARILLVMTFSIGLTLLLMPFVDKVYLEQFYTPETTILPALLSAGAGVVMYAIGWRWVVGYVGERPPESKRVILYALVGTIILLTVLTLLVIGAVIGAEQ